MRVLCGCIARKNVVRVCVYVMLRFYDTLCMYAMLSMYVMYVCTLCNVCMYVYNVLMVP